MDQDTDVVLTLQELNSKLTKKAIRKPNVTEVSEEYGSLAKGLDSQSCSAYAGLAHIHRARAERLVPNGIAEANSLRDAGQSYSAAWAESVNQIGLLDTGTEANAIVNCLVQSSRVLSELGDPLLASRRLCELGDVLFSGRRFNDAVVAYQRALSSLNATDTMEQSVYLNRLFQTRSELMFTVSNGATDEQFLSGGVIGRADLAVPPLSTLSEDLQLQDPDLSITAFLIALVKIAAFLRASYPLAPVSALLNLSAPSTANNRGSSSSDTVVPKSADNSDVTFAEDCECLNRFLNNYPGCWRGGHSQLLRALAEAVWWRDSQAALAVEHALLPRLTGSQTQRSLCALVVSCVVSPIVAP